MLPQAGQFGPGPGAVGRSEKCSVLNTRVDRVGIGRGRLEVPDASEFPRVRRAVVPEMRVRRAFVCEFVPNGFPRFSAVIGSLQHLAKPGAALRRVDTVGIGPRAFQVVDLPTGKMGTADIPIFSRAV